MSAFFTDGDFTVKTPTGKARISYPFERDLTARIVEQDYIQLKSSYSVASLNTTHGSIVGGGDSSAYLVEVGPHEDLGAGVIKWTEFYASKPAERSEYESFAYNFIGYYGVWGTAETTISGRPRFTQTVTSRLAFKYYIPGIDVGIATAADIPIIAAQAYIYGSTTNNVDYLADSPPFTAATSPSRTAYEAVVAGGSGLGTGAATGEIIAEQSIVRPWRGGIYERVTRYVKAL